jgi:hypothetical protein
MTIRPPLRPDPPSPWLVLAVWACGITAALLIARALI